MQVYLEALGCRLNAAEIETLARNFAGAGHWVVSRPDSADLIVLNSCAVTAKAARTSRHRLRALHRLSPNAQLAVVGCWATGVVAEAQALPGVRWVIANPDKSRAVQMITGDSATPAAWAPGRWGHTRAFLGVQDGCDHHCTYCITRVLRGAARSRPLAEAVAEVHYLVAQGAQEVILTGVSLGAYGQDLGLVGGLTMLVRTILADTTLPRLRLSSVEPWDVDAQLLPLLAHPRFCRQLHLPLQSGSDAVLKRMGRPFTTAQFARLVADARAVSPDVAITTDIITGFPGETESDFQSSLDFVTQVNFARLHVFPYSERAGTAATRLPNPVPKVKRAERAAQLRVLGQQLAATYRARFIGQTLPVLWERCNENQVWRGLTDNYLVIRTTAEQYLYNCLLPTRITASIDDGLIGDLLPDAICPRPSSEIT